MNEKFKVYTDCVHFPLDRPCFYQKNCGALCADCPNYKKISLPRQLKKILIIKLGAMGDVLRTTFLLEGLKELYPSSAISWIVNKSNAAVLENNPLIDSIIVKDGKTNEFLTQNFFDFVINLDLSAESLAFAKLSCAGKIAGYTLSDNREIVSSNDYALQWLQMSAYDELKKSNKFTYQNMMAKIVGLSCDKYAIAVALAKNSVAKAEEFIKKFAIKQDKEIIGINPGAGGRWPLKKWRADGFVKTAQHFAAKGHAVLLLGGRQDEEEINNIMRHNIENVFSAGTDNSIPDFFALINLCDLILCADTMAMHAAAGLRKKVVALFGPTSLEEIELYGRGIKIQPDMDCICCYKQNCDKKETCMDNISAGEVISAIENLLLKI
jgi:heptosyltransferase-2